MRIFRHVLYGSATCFFVLLLGAAPLLAKCAHLKLTGFLQAEPLTILDFKFWVLESRRSARWQMFRRRSYIIPRESRNLTAILCVGQTPAGFLASLEWQAPGSIIQNPA
jgi:hypothetical protein